MIFMIKIWLTIVITAVVVTEIHDMVIDHDLYKLFIFKKDKQKDVSDYQWSISIMVTVDGIIADKDCNLR